MLLLALCLVNVALATGFVCDFDRDTCGFTQSKTDDFDWIRNTGRTPSSGTGPTSDHSGNGYYMYIEASSPRKKGDRAIMEKSLSLKSGRTCISFFYNMYGQYVDKLKVLVNNKEVLTLSGNKGVNWMKSEISVNERANSVAFEGVRGDSWDGDIAIDDVEIKDCGGGGGDGCDTQPPTPPPPQTAAPPQSGCGIRPKTRIVGGTAARPGDWPWQGMLRTSSGFPFCGGSLVAARWLVTASHCVQGKTASSLFVRLGAHKRTTDLGNEQDFKVTKIIMHHSYNSPSKYSHDIALLKLDRPAVLGRYVNLVCLPNSVPAPTDGTTCWITGWGRLAAGGATPELLQQVSVPVVSHARCDKSYSGKIHDSMICAGLDQGGIDACQGDSGGPMVCETGGRYYLHGATSWGYGCAAPRYFGVYAKVKYLMGWLNREMSQN